MNVQRYAVLASDICVMFNSVKTVSILIYNVYTDTPRDQGNVSDCTGCQNTQVLFQLTEILWDRKCLSDVTQCRKTQVSDCTDSTIFM